MVDPMGYIPAAMTEQKRNGDLELNQFFNCFSATNEASGNQNEAHRHQGHGQYELHVFWLRKNVVRIQFNIILLTKKVGLSKNL